MSRQHIGGPSEPATLEERDAYSQERIRKGMDRAAFREYLRTTTQRMLTRNCWACPLAAFMNDGFSGERIGFDPDAHCEYSPSWHPVFGKLVDAEPGDTITPQRALELLDSVP